jgi:hypothetical protein
MLNYCAHQKNHISILQILLLFSYEIFSFNTISFVLVLCLHGIKDYIYPDVLKYIDQILI